MILDDDCEVLEPALDLLAYLDIDLIDPTSCPCLHWQVDILAVLNRPHPEDGAVHLHEVADLDDYAVYRGDADEVGEANPAIAIGVVTVEIRILFCIAAIFRMDAVVILPTIRHAISVGVGVEWTGEVGRTPGIGDLVLLDVAESVLITIAIGVGRVSGVEQGVVAILESIGHSITIRVPVTRSIEAAVAIHVLVEPGQVADSAHQTGVWCIHANGAELRHAAMDLKIETPKCDLYAVWNQIIVTILLERIGVVALLEIIRQ